MGYPYSFERLTIIEPPRAARHDIYRDVVTDDADRVATPQGEVRYHFSSMADLSAFPEQSVDLVFSGESIEHVTRTDVENVLREVRRILKPDGSFCFDTPNRAVTEIQCPESFINPDHKHEYTHEEMSRFAFESSVRDLWKPRGSAGCPRRRPPASSTMPRWSPTRDSSTTSAIATCSTTAAEHLKSFAGGRAKGESAALVHGRFTFGSSAGETMSIWKPSHSANICTCTGCFSTTSPAPAT